MSEGLFDDRSAAGELRDRRDRQVDEFAAPAGGEPRPTGKRLLVTLSHAIEQAVLGSPDARSMTVVALFQQGSYFARERRTYERIAATGARVVIAHADLVTPVPDGIVAIEIAEDEPLADEWSVVAVGPASGGFLVATDQHRVDAGESGWEAGRQFLGRWGFSRMQAGSELARLRAAFGRRLPDDAAAAIDELVGSCLPAGGQRVETGGSPAEAFATACLGHLTARLHRAGTETRELGARLADAERAADAQARAGTDRWSGLPTGELLGRWTSPASGPVAGRTALTLGLVLVDLPELAASTAADRERFHAGRAVAACLTQPLGSVDVALSVGDGQFLVVLPGATADELATTSLEIVRQLELCGHGYPHIPLGGTIAATRSAYRPLPITDLHRALHGPIRVTDTGDPIAVAVVSSSAAQRADPDRPTGETVDRPAGRALAEASWPSPVPRRTLSSVGPGGAGPPRAAEGRAAENRGRVDEGRGDEDRAAAES